MSADLIERAAARLNRDRGPKPEAAVDARPGIAVLQRAPSMDSVVQAEASSRPTVNGLVAPQGETAKPGPVRRIRLDPAALSRAGIMTPDSESSRIVEEFRVIKRPLLVKALSTATPRLARTNVILVTSARPGEGKSFVACNLAMSIASERNCEVVLIDADLQSPSMAQLFGLQPGPGLIELLSSPGAAVSDLVLRTNFANLSLLPAGRGPSQSTELLASQKMVSVLDDLAAGLGDRIVILDAAPLLASSEPAVLALNVGQIVLVIEAERTGRRAVEEALGHLGGCPNIGLVLNRARSWLGGEQFGTYYGQQHS